MAYVNFKPVCNCGYIFKNFIYTQSQREELMNAEREFIGLRRRDEWFLPCRCLNCGERITDFTIPVFTRKRQIVYKEEE